MKVTILGSGTSSGVPRIGNHWGACDPEEPRNRRRRVSILVEEGGTRLLVDTSPDLRAQCLDAGIDRLDAVLYTHDHADHTHGIDDLRPIAQMMGRRVPVFSDASTLRELERRFAYAFREQAGYPPIVEPRTIDPAAGPFEIGAVTVTPFVQAHGPETTSLGFRFGPAAYSTDVSGLSEEAFAVLADVDLWVVDALRYRPHPTHSHLAQTLAWIERVRPARAVLTHMNLDMDYRTLRDSLPPGVEPGYDGLVIEVG